MFKKIILPAVFASFSFSATANWIGGISYQTFAEDEPDLSLNSVVGTLAYKFNYDSKLSVIPALRLGTGTGEDEFTELNASVAIERFISVSVRAQYELSPYIYMHIEPAYSNLETKLEWGGETLTEDEWEAGVGIGAGFNTNELVAIEFTYEQYDGTDVFNFATRINF